MPSGIEGIVIDTQKFSRKMSLSEDERKVFEREYKQSETEGNAEIAQAFMSMVDEIEKAVSVKLADDDGTPLSGGQDRSTSLNAPKFLIFRVC